MGHGKRPARSSRRKKRSSPVDIIASIDTTTCERVERGASPRRSPSRVLATALRAETDLPDRRNGEVPLGTSWPTKHQSTRSWSPSKASSLSHMQNSPITPSFWGIWVENHEYLRRQSLRWMSNNADDADDVLSNAMLLAHRKFPKYADSITNPRAWLTRLVHNVCMDHHRAVSRRQGVETNVRWDEVESYVLSTEQQTVRQPDHEATNEELLVSLLNGLLNLPASLSEPLTLRCLYGLAYPDIASHMNLTECAVRKRVQLARNKLSHWMEAS